VDAGAADAHLALDQERAAVQLGGLIAALWPAGPLPMTITS